MINSTQPTEPKYAVGDEVIKLQGDYFFTGEVRSVFTKKRGLIRYVVENPDGILHIFSEGQLDKREVKSL